MEGLFIQLLADNNRVSFNDDTLRVLLLRLKQENIDKMKSFVTDLLKCCKAEQLKNSQFLQGVLDILVDGIMPFHEELFYDIDRTLPGLNFFLLGKNGNRRKVLYLLETNPYFRELRNKKVQHKL